DTPRYISESFGRGFVLLAVSPLASLARELDALAADTQDAPHPLRVLSVGEGGLDDAHGQLRERYGVTAGAVVLIRPDGYVLGRWAAPQAAQVRAALAPYYPLITQSATQEGQA
ncbi:MAG: FAD-dependent oxidoreductase, partial [Achromobacter spanius]